MYSYNSYQALKAINEAIDDILNNVDMDQAEQIKSIVKSQDDIFKKYDVPSNEIDNIKVSIEDTIRVKLGI